MARRNITLSADQELIYRARVKALQEKKSLNSIFQEWLEHYVGNNTLKSYRNLMKNLSHVKPSKRFSRNEMNER